VVAHRSKGQKMGPVLRARASPLGRMVSAMASGSAGQ
jgi:hypothetical protein